MKLNPVLLVAGAGLHDVEEDGAFETVDEVLSKVFGIVDNFDTGLDPLFEEAKTLGISLGELKTGILGLLTHPNMREKLHAVLCVLSNKTVLDAEGEKRAAHQDITGAKGVVKKRSPQPLTVYKQYSSPHGTHKKFGKMDGFLKRLYAFEGSRRDITKEVRQCALILKMEDRANNMITISSADPVEQRDELQVTFTRLIAYAMLDANLESAPVYNALPRLIDVTMKEYDRFSSQHSGLMTSEDRRYMTQLREWQKTVKRYELPQEMQHSKDAFESHRGI